MEFLDANAIGIVSALQPLASAYERWRSKSLFRLAAALYAASLAMPVCVIVNSLLQRSSSGAFVGAAHDFEALVAVSVFQLTATGLFLGARIARCSRLAAIAERQDVSLRVATDPRERRVANALVVPLAAITAGALAMSWAAGVLWLSFFASYTTYLVALHLSGCVSRPTVR